MAKSKKASASAKDAEETVSKKPAPKKAAARKGSAPAGTPMINTALAAESAARLLAAGVGGKPDAGQSPALPRAESAMFKQMKSGLSKPAGQTMSNLLDKQGGAGQKKSAVPFGASKQVGHNQTFGADVNRAGVPRRTGG